MGASHSSNLHAVPVILAASLQDSIHASTKRGRAPAQLDDTRSLLHWNEYERICDGVNRERDSILHSHFTH